MYLDYVVHALYTQINYCAPAHGRQVFYGGGWVENQSTSDFWWSPLFSFCFWTQRRIHISTTPVVRQLHLTNFG